jgi:hypothetical protein
VKVPREDPQVIHGKELHKIYTTITARISDKWNIRNVSITEIMNNMRVVRKIRFPMIFHNEKHVYWH